MGLYQLQLPRSYTFSRVPPASPPPLQSPDSYLSLDCSCPLVNWKVQTPMFYNIDQVIEGLKDLFRSELVEVPRWRKWCCSLRWVNNLNTLAARCKGVFLDFSVNTLTSTAYFVIRKFSDLIHPAWEAKWIACLPSWSLAVMEACTKRTWHKIMMDRDGEGRGVDWGAISLLMSATEWKKYQEKVSNIYLTPCNS